MGDNIFAGDAVILECFDFSGSLYIKGHHAGKKLSSSP